LWQPISPSFFNEYQIKEYGQIIQSARIREEYLQNRESQQASYQTRYNETNYEAGKTKSSSNHDSVREKKRPKIKPKIFTIPFIVCCIILIIFISTIVYMTFSMTNYSLSSELISTKLIFVNKTVQGETISYENIFNRKEQIDRDVSLKGRIRTYLKGDVRLANYVTQIVDDYGNTINLVDLPLKYKVNYQNKETGDQLFLIRGVIRNKSGDFELAPYEIIPINRSPNKIISKQKILSNHTMRQRSAIKPRYPSVRNSVYGLFNVEIKCDDGTLLNKCSQTKPFECTDEGLIQNPEVCGCPTNQLLNWNDRGTFECIPDKCDDGTLVNNCSVDKPYYCTPDGLKEKTITCGCPEGKRLKNAQCIPDPKCSDGTHDSECSPTKNMQCVNGKFVLNAQLCGCPSGYIESGNKCEPVCKDNTIFDQCSDKKPLFCSMGQLIQKASRCGCPEEEVPIGDSCISKYVIDPKQVTLSYTLRGDHKSIDYTAYKGLNDYLADNHAGYSCSGCDYVAEDFSDCCTSNSELARVNDIKQDQYLITLVQYIQGITSNKDDQVRIAISLVQHIPYDKLGYSSGNLTGKYPYEVVYSGTGVCGEKSKLLAYLLKKLGYGTALFLYAPIHESVGIKCPLKYQYQNTGYCFIESTNPSIVTDTNGDYAGLKLAQMGTPDVIKVSDGYSFDTVGEEYNDADYLNEIRSMGRTIPRTYFNDLVKIYDKYGFNYELRDGHLIPTS